MMGQNCNSFQLFQQVKEQEHTLERDKDSAASRMNSLNPSASFYVRNRGGAHPPTPNNATPGSVDNLNFRETLEFQQLSMVTCKFPEFHFCLRRSLQV